MPNYSEDDFPKGPKSTWAAQARDICGQPPEKLVPMIPHLLTWLIDYNWPGAHEIGDLLLGFGGIVLPHVKKILAQADADPIWKYWLVVVFACNWNPELVRQLNDELVVLATNDDEDEINLVALKALLRCKLLDRIHATNLISAKERSHPEWESDLADLKELLTY